MRVARLTNALMPLQMFEPSEGPLAVWTLETLFLLPRLSLRDLLFAGSGFHQRPMAPLPLTQGPIATDLVSDTQILEQLEKPDEVWRLPVVFGKVGEELWDCGERTGARRRDGSYAG
jgi:hypothetical protein